MRETELAEWTAWIEAPRRLRVRDAFVERVASDPALDLHWLTEEKRWLRARIDFSVSGPRPAMEALLDDVRAAAAMWNARHHRVSRSSFLSMG
jgi:hypothetical protein